MNDHHKTSISPPNVESDSEHESVGEGQASQMDTRVDIHVISYRARNHDPDGISAKAAIDGLVRFGLLPDDSAKEVKKVSFESFFCEKEDERTEIIIEDINQ